MQYRFKNISCKLTPSKEVWRDLKYTAAIAQNHKQTIIIDLQYLRYNVLKVFQTYGNK